MSETLQPYEDLDGIVAEMQKLAQLSVSVGFDTLSCASRDGSYHYILRPLKESAEGVCSLGIEQLGGIKEWSLVRSSRENDDGHIELTRYGVLTDKNADLMLIASQHDLDPYESDLGKAADIINSSIQLQYEAGMATPDMRDYADLENALGDISSYTETMILLHQLGALLPYALEELANSN